MDAVRKAAEFPAPPTPGLNFTLLILLVTLSTLYEGKPWWCGSVIPRLRTQTGGSQARIKSYLHSKTLVCFFVFCFLFFCCFVLFCFFRDRVSLCSPGCPGAHFCRPGWPRTQKSAYRCLPSAGIKGVCHQHQTKKSLFLSSLLRSVKTSAKPFTVNSAVLMYSFLFCFNCAFTIGKS
jgi:hypothetical protein